MDPALKNRFSLGRQSSMAPHHSDVEEGLHLSELSLLDDNTLLDNVDKTMFLLFLSCKGDEKGIASHLAEGVNVNAGDFDDRTALHVAACEGIHWN